MKKVLFTELINPALGIKNDYTSSVTAAGEVFCFAVSNGITDLYISQKEYFAVLKYVWEKLPYDWDGKSIMGVRFHII